MRRLLLTMLLLTSLMTYAQDSKHDVDTALAGQIRSFILKYGKPMHEQSNRAAFFTCPKCFNQSIKNQKRLLRKHTIHQKKLGK